MSTYLDLGIHFVFATKNRAPMIQAHWRSELHRFLGASFLELGASPLAIGGVEDHVHALVSLRATHAVAEVTREVKRISSDWSKRHFAGFAWQEGYAAFAVPGPHRERVRAYIANQEAHHRGTSSQDELRKLLEEHGLEIDERYFL